tara:strand:- start:829 stop:1086 length:258 start_codon:yes stop_codon:yes gene_type:complete
MTHEVIMEVLQWARDNNVIRIKVGDVEAEFAPAPISHEGLDLPGDMNDHELNSYINSTLEEQGEQQKKDEAQEQKERNDMMYYSS